MNPHSAALHPVINPSHLHGRDRIRTCKVKHRPREVICACRLYLRQHALSISTAGFEPAIPGFQNLWHTKLAHALWLTEPNSGLLNLRTLTSSATTLKTAINRPFATSDPISAVGTWVHVLRVPYTYPYLFLSSIPKEKSPVENSHRGCKIPCRRRQPCAFRA